MRTQLVSKPPSLVTIAIALLLAGEGAAQGLAQAQAASGSESAPRTRLVLLGTGTPNADPDRSGPAVAVVVDDRPYLVDLGPGVVRRAAAARRAGVEALAVANLDIAFITHLHSDHTVGYPDFIFTPWVLERDHPAKVYGPAGLKAMTEHLLAAYERDIRIRIDGLEPANTEGYKVEATEVEPEVVYQDDLVRVIAFRVPHGSWEEAFGYRFETPDRTIVISGDTGPSPAIAENCRGCDILVHEVYSVAGFQGLPAVWQRYHASFHTSARELGEIAAAARPGLLVLYHQLLWGSTPEELVEEVASAYEGTVVYGRDLDVF